MLYIIGTLRHRVPIASENALQCPHRLKHQKGRKRAEIARKCSALPCNVSCAVAQCRRAYSCKKIGRGIPARFLRFTNFHRCFCLCKYPQTRPLGVVRVFAWVRPSSRNTGRIWRSTAVIRSAYPRGISPCRRASRSSTRCRRVRFLLRYGRGRGASRLP